MTQNVREIIRLLEGANEGVAKPWGEGGGKTPIAFARGECARYRECQTTLFTYGSSGERPKPS